jgi:hypothetical protein
MVPLGDGRCLAWSFASSDRNINDQYINCAEDRRAGMVASAVKPNERDDISEH